MRPGLQFSYPGQVAVRDKATLRLCMSGGRPAAQKHPALIYPNKLYKTVDFDRATQLSGFLHCPASNRALAPGWQRPAVQQTKHLSTTARGKNSEPQDLAAHLQFPVEKD